MENKEEAQNMKIEENNLFNPSFHNSNHISDSKSNLHHKEHHKINQFMLTPLEGFLLNKKMPRGFKFEVEENIRPLELQKNHSKRLTKKTSLQNSEIPIKSVKNNLNEGNINSAEKKETPKIIKKTKKPGKEANKNTHTNINNNTNNNINSKSSNNSNNNNINEKHNSESYKIMIKCISGLNKIKLCQGANIFYSTKIPGAPCLSNIEKKVQNFEYKTLDECFDDIRKLWNYQFKNHAKDPNVYQNIWKMSSLTESILKDLKNEKNTFSEKKEEITGIKKRTEKIKKELEELNGNSQKDLNNKLTKTKNITSIHKLSQMITTLSKQQLRGILPILLTKDEINVTKNFEFDLDKLSDDKFKKLETYVANCINENKNTNIINNKKEIRNNNKKNGNINTNNGIYKNNNNINNNNNQNSLKKEDKKAKNTFSESDSLSSESSF